LPTADLQQTAEMDLISIQLSQPKTANMQSSFAAKNGNVIFVSNCKKFSSKGEEIKMHAINKSEPDWEKIAQIFSSMQRPITRSFENFLWHNSIVSFRIHPRPC